MTLEIFEKKSFNYGRCFGSKSRYMSNNPTSTVYFNANIITLESGKIWFGDLDMTKDSITLTEIAREIGQDLYILREHDCWDDKEFLSNTEYAKNAVATIFCI